MGYQRSKQKMPPKKLMHAVKHSIPMLGILLGTGCIQETTSGNNFESSYDQVITNPQDMSVIQDMSATQDILLEDYLIFSNPKGSNYDLSTPDQSLLDQGMIEDQGLLEDQGMLEDSSLPNADQSMGSQKNGQK
jgi:hypothetical protein